MATMDDAGAAPRPSQGGAIAEYFKFAERGTDLVTEAKAGLTTFMVMAYILLVNPFILANMVGAPGSPESQAFVPAAAAATDLPCLSATRFLSTSDTPNSPIIAGMKLIPSYSSGNPNVKRACVWTALSPTVASNKPSNSANSAFSTAPPDTITLAPAWVCRRA